MNGAAWLEKVKALPTSIRVKALLLYALFLKFWLPDISRELVGVSENADLQLHAMSSVSCYLSVSAGIVVACFIIGESIRGISAPVKRNKVVENGE